MQRGFSGHAFQNLLLICLAWCSGCMVAPEPADLVFLGGAVYTLDQERPWADGVAVAGGRIVYVGDEAGVALWIGDGTRVIDIGEGMLMPGFHDSHMHPMAAGSRYLRCPLDGLDWPEEVLSRLAACAASLEPGAWLRATGLDPAAFAGQGPDAALLDSVSGGHPALVSTDFAKAAWINGQTMRLAGIDGATPAPDGGEIVRDPQSGAPTGVLRGEAVALVWALSTDYSEAELRHGLRQASALANSLGITSANEASTSRSNWAAYRAAEQAGEMTLRVNASLRWDQAQGAEQLQAMLHMRDQADGPRFRADSVKFFLDGDGQTASLLEPYSGSTEVATSFYGESLAKRFAAVDAAGFHLHLHAYGDRAVRDGLDAIAHAIAANPPWMRRHQLAHVALVDAADLPRFAELGVAANIQPLWAWWSEEQQKECEGLGPERCARLLAFRDLFDSGAPVVAGSDWISESMSPLYGIQVAVTRRPPDGSGPAWNPRQRVTLEEMLRAYTIEGARLYSQDAMTGSIEVGKAADLILLERNLFEAEPMAIKDVKVQLTLLEGEVVYERANER